MAARGIDMQSFDAWLSSLPAKGYDSLWITNNLPALRKRFADYGEMPMPEMVGPHVAVRDRYEEL